MEEYQCGKPASSSVSWYAPCTCSCLGKIKGEMHRIPAHASEKLRERG
jgi:hypothetical protein